MKKKLHNYIIKTSSTIISAGKTYEYISLLCYIIMGTLLAFQYNILNSVLYLSKFSEIASPRYLFCNLKDEIPHILPGECGQSNRLLNQLCYVLVSALNTPLFTSERVILLWPTKNEICYLKITYLVSLNGSFKANISRTEDT